MGKVISFLDTSSKVTSFFVGSGIIALATVAVITAQPVTEIAAWAKNVLGLSFVVLLSGLIFISLFSWVRILSENDDRITIWFETGVLAANGVTTLALTFTLLGISLGIGSLAGQELTPETIQPVIRRMTANFSLAFMTTVIGLPLSALLRALIIVTHTRRCGVNRIQNKEVST